MLFDMNELKHLDLQKSNINDEYLDKLGDVIGSSDKIHMVNLRSNNNITDDGLNKLMNNMVGNTSLRELDLSYNQKITIKSIPCLMEMAEVTSITTLIMYYTGMTYLELEQVHKAFRKPIDEREIPIKSKTKSAAKMR